MIDLRDYDQREHGTHEAALKRGLLEPDVDQDLAQRIRDGIREAMEQSEARACLARYRREQRRRA